jgi:hypothetical protein
MITSNASRVHYRLSRNTYTHLPTKHEVTKKMKETRLFLVFTCSIHLILAPQGRVCLTLKISPSNCAMMILKTVERVMFETTLNSLMLPRVRFIFCHVWRREGIQCASIKSLSQMSPTIDNFSTLCDAVIINTEGDSDHTGPLERLKAFTSSRYGSVPCH